MRTTTVWTLLLAMALVAVPGVALAQDDGEPLADGTTIVSDPVGVIEPTDTLEEVTPASTEEIEAATECDIGGITSTGSSSHNSVQERTRSQDVEVDENDVLLSIALANNGATDIDWATVRSFDVEETETMSVSSTAELDRDDVFNALALGVSADGGSLDALACVSNVDHTRTVTTTASRDVSLDENSVLLAIALANSVGGDLSFNEIADIDEAERQEVTEDRDVDIERDNAFLALALGAGGQDGSS